MRGAHAETHIENKSLAARPRGLLNEHLLAHPGTTVKTIVWISPSRAEAIRIIVRSRARECLLNVAFVSVVFAYGIRNK